MPAANYLPDILETTEAERLATGFVFTEGPLWHPYGYYYFVDIRQNKLYRMTPGRAPEVVRDTAGGNGTTFDLQGRLVLCEGDGRRVVRIGHDGMLETLVHRYHTPHQNINREIGQVPTEMIDERDLRGLRGVYGGRKRAQHAQAIEDGQREGQESRIPLQKRHVNSTRTPKCTPSAFRRAACTIHLIH